MIVEKEMELIHFGHDAFDLEKFNPISDAHWVKPNGGLWASPVSSERGWKEWCEAEDFGSLDTSFSFMARGRFLVVDGKSDMDELSWIDIPSSPFISFEILLACGIDAVHLTDKGETETRFTRPRSLYGWDCESVLVMNPECVRVCHQLFRK